VSSEQRSLTLDNGQEHFPPNYELQVVKVKLFGRVPDRLFVAPTFVRLKRANWELDPQCSRPTIGDKLQGLRDRETRATEATYIALMIFCRALRLHSHDLPSSFCIVSTQCLLLANRLVKLLCFDSLYSWNGNYPSIPMAGIVYAHDLSIADRLVLKNLEADITRYNSSTRTEDADSTSDATDSVSSSLESISTAAEASKRLHGSKGQPSNLGSSGRLCPTPWLDASLTIQS
jgi:hypothetical protein